MEDIDLVKEIQQELLNIDRNRFSKIKEEMLDEEFAGESYPCDVCSCAYNAPNKLMKHQRTHTAHKLSICSLCFRSFCLEESYTAHQRTHTQERFHQCRVCDRSFEHSDKLDRHMRTHTGDRPHHCDMCNKSFIQSGQLVIHMRSHTGEKPYACSGCPKGFTCSKQLKVHMRTHTGEKPYKCDLCDKSFGYNHVLKLHQVQHYGCRVFKCTICLRTFSGKKEMEQHIISHVEADLPRPCSTSSSALSLASSEKEYVPSSTYIPQSVRNHPFYTSPAVSPVPSVLGILPSINSIGLDEEELRSMPAQPPRKSVLTRNPLYPITLSLIQTFMEEDRNQFGSLPVIQTPSLGSILSAMEQEEPINLSLKKEDCKPSCPTPATSPPACPTPSSSPPSFLNMTVNSLPLRKRRLVSSLTELGRGSVIKFAHQRS